MFVFAPPRRAHKPSLTPMIDVVFLLLVFFMLASQFGRNTALPLSMAGGDASYSGPPRLVEIGAVTLRLNGIALSVEDLPEQLRSMMDRDDAMIILRGNEGTTLQRLIDVAEVLQQSGFTRLTVVE